MLSDFGIAVISETGRTTLNAPYGTAGTPYYMAPEMFRGKPDKASDQYALAVMIYQWLSGTLPFDQGDWIQLGYQHTHEPVPPLRERAPFVSRDVETVVMKALAKDPKERFATVQAFATALKQASQAEKPAHGLIPWNIEPSKTEQLLPPIVPAPLVVQVVTQPGIDTPVEQLQPSVPKQSKQSQVQAKPRLPMPEQSSSSTSFDIVWFIILIIITIIAAPVETAFSIALLFKVYGGKQLHWIIVPVMIAARIAASGASVLKLGWASAAIATPTALIAALMAEAIGLHFMIKEWAKLVIILPLLLPVGLVALFLIVGASIMSNSLLGLLGVSSAVGLIVGLIGSAVAFEPSL